MVGWTFETCLQYGLYFDNSNDFSGMTIWNMSVYVHLCRSMGDMLVIQKILVGWIFETCPFMSIYVAVWFFFIIDEIWKTYIYVHLCCSMVDIVIIQKILVGWNLKHVHVFPFMLQYGWHFHNSKQIRKKNIFQNWKNILCICLVYSMYTFFSIPEDTLKRIFFNSIFHVPV